MYEYIVAIIVGIVCVVIGIMNTRGIISMMHSYHRKRVKEEDIIPFGRLTGAGMITIGGGIIVSGALSLISFLSGGSVFEHIGTGIAIATLVVGVVLIFAAMKKYNKGIF